MAWFSLGGIAYFTDGQVRRSYTAADGLGEGWVADLRLDQDGTLWAATEGGLSRLKGHVTTFTSNYHEDRTHLGLAKDTPACRDQWEANCVSSA